MLADILIEELAVHCIIGCMPEERIHKQRLLVSIRASYNIAEPARTDNVDDAMNYAFLSKDIKTMLENSQCYILESLINRVFDLIFKRDVITQATVTIVKPDAIDFVKQVGITQTRQRV